MKVALLHYSPDVEVLAAPDLAFFTFKVTGASRATTRYLIREGIATYAAESPATMAPSGFEVFHEVHVKEHKEILARLQEVIEQADVGEEAGMFLTPEDPAKAIIITMTAEDLYSFLTARSCERAIWEIRSMTAAMVMLVRPVAGAVFRTVGPGCLESECPEGVHSCGKTADVRAFYSIVR